MPDDETKTSADAIAAAFTFEWECEPEAIVENRMGRMTQRQQQSLLAVIQSNNLWNYAILYGAFMCVLVVTVIMFLGNTSGTQAQHLLTVGILVGAAAVGAAAFFRFNARRTASINAGTLVHVDGQIKSRVVYTDMGRSWRIAIDGKLFFIRVRCGSLLMPGTSYRVYYAPYTREVLNIEPLPD